MFVSVQMLSWQCSAQDRFLIESQIKFSKIVLSTLLLRFQILSLSGARTMNLEIDFVDTINVCPLKLSRNKRIKRVI